MVPSHHLTFTSQKGTLLLVHPMLATLGHCSEYLQDGAIVQSDVLTSQKGSPLLVHPIVHPNIGSPRDVATLGEIGSALLPPTFRHYNQSFCLFLLSTQNGGGGEGGGLQCCYPYKTPCSVAKQPNYHCWYC